VEGADSVQISITARHGHLSEESQEKIEAKVEKLVKYFERIMAIEVVIDLQDETQPGVEIMVSAEHKHDFVATDKSANLQNSLDATVHKLEQQLRKYKEKVQERHRSTAPRRQDLSATVEGKPETETAAEVSLDERED
jgi:putative sigma-54 modulation protein